ncbi:MAG TPA: zinc-ribbon domain-containing protein [Acetobacteraceae bacterium]|nr:zinc-ribbon domain-containing protein [Acetobacteraceae bacterium]
MRFVCPRCAAAYQVPPTALGGRRRLRCARCGCDWVVQGEPVEGAEAAAEASGGTQEPAEPRSPMPVAPVGAPPPPIRGATAALLLAWGASLLVLALGAWGAVAWRGSVVHAWPPSQRLYGALGLTPEAIPDGAKPRHVRHANEQTVMHESSGG